MDFGLSEDQQLLKTTIGRFLAEQCPTTRVREIMEGGTGHDATLWTSLAELGVAALPIPEAHGGLGADLLDLALAAEELGYAATPGPFLGASMAAIGLAEGDNEELKARWLPQASAGSALGTIAIGEAESVWDPDAIAASVSDGKLSGRKPLVPYAAVSDFIVVAARDGEETGLWLVEAGAAGMEITTLSGNDMSRRLDDVVFDQTPARRVGDGHALERCLDAGLILISADAFGGARRCLEMTRDYSLEREQFGQPIGAFQSYKHQLADIAAEVEPCMSLYWYAAHTFDAFPDQTSKHAALAKLRIGEVFNDVAFKCTELHGGIGFTWEYDLQLWFRRALFDKAFLGEAVLHCDRVADMAGW
jgi:alkylation response protein AidB-like acyl-CoA dehydrogenase